MSLPRIAAIFVCAYAFLAGIPRQGQCALTRDDERFLDLVERKAFDFFWNEADPQSGLIRDQASNFAPDTNDFRVYRASIASVGFGLSAYCIGVERGWITRTQAEERVRNTLQLFDTQLERDGYNLYYHWIDMRTNKRWMWDASSGSEFSSIDSALFVAGAITVGEYFDAKFGEPEFKQTAERIYRRIKWNQFGEHLTSFYNEYILVTLLGMGCPENTISTNAWRAMGRNYQVSTANRKGEANFIHLFPQAWFDFRNKHDEYANYFLNSRNAVLANRQYCIDHSLGGIAEPKFQFSTYGSNVWGLSACEAPPPKGYNHYGEAEPALADTPDSGMRGIDGTVAIHAAGGSLPFTPDESLAMLKHLSQTYKDDLWGRYGFCDSFNTDPRIRDRFNNPSKTLWRAEIVSGIDQGIILLMAENLRTGLAWRYFMKNPFIQSGMDKAGFVRQAEPPPGAQINLAGDWRFRTGDKGDWKKPEFDDNGWKKIKVPAHWEEEGYPGYDGLAWYRTSIFIPADSPLRKSKVILRLGAVDDADQTFFNGVNIGGMGDFPPGRNSAWDVMRIYPVPANLIHFGATNVIAVRVNDNALLGGIWRAPVDLVSPDAIQYRPFYVNIPGI
jgi:hypothetical protein